MKEKLTAHDVWYQEFGHIFKANTRMSVRYYHNTDNDRTVFKSGADGKWYGKKTLSFGAEIKKEFKTEHEACIWLLARDKKELK